MTKDEALDLALEVMRNQGDVGVDEWLAAEAAIKQALALDKKAENARELGLDYEPVLKDNSNYRYDPPVAEPVAWIEHEWSGSGLRHLHFERREQSVRDEVMNPIWTPLYTTPPAAPDLQAELEATNRQVEILSDALAESRREVDAMIALARADEREACAALADKLEWADNKGVASAIRARGNA
jgi:hypothetical protein